jgi:hypothetical protein
MLGLVGPHRADGYVNATALSHAAGIDVAAWHGSPEEALRLVAASTLTGLTPVALLQTDHAGDLWTHPQLALVLARRRSRR